MIAAFTADPPFRRGELSPYGEPEDDPVLQHHAFYQQRLPLSSGPAGPPLATNRFLGLHWPADAMRYLTERHEFRAWRSSKAYELPGMVSG